MPRIVVSNDSCEHAIIQPAGKSYPLSLIPQKDLEDLYRAYGALLFRGFDFSTADFAAFTKATCTTATFNETPGRQVIDPNSMIQSVDKGNGWFPQHPELSRVPWKPDAAFFACDTPPEKGGETTICDGIKIVNELPLDLRKEMEGARLRYRERISSADLKTWFGTSKPTEEQLKHPPAHCPFEFEKFLNFTLSIFTAPFLHKPMFHDSLAFGNFVLFSHARGVDHYPLRADGSKVPKYWITALSEISEALKVPIQWERGDVLLLDNTRFTHGRNAFPAHSNRKILTFFGFLRFAKPGPEEPRNAIWRQRCIRKNADTSTKDF